MQEKWETYFHNIWHFVNCHVLVGTAHKWQTILIFCQMVAAIFLFFASVWPVWIPVKVKISYFHAAKSQSKSGLCQRKGQENSLLVSRGNPDSLETFSSGQIWRFYLSYETLQFNRTPMLSTMAALNGHRLWWKSKFAHPGDLKNGSVWHPDDIILPP